MHITSFEEFTTTISDVEKKNQEDKHADLDQPTQMLGAKPTPQFSSKSLPNFMYKFSNHQEISKMLQETLYEEFEALLIRKFKYNRNKEQLCFKKT